MTHPLVVVLQNPHEITSYTQKAYAPFCRELKITFAMKNTGLITREVSAYDPTPCLGRPSDHVSGLGFPGLDHRGR